MCFTPDPDSAPRVGAHLGRRAPDFGGEDAGCRAVGGARKRVGIASTASGSAEEWLGQEAKVPPRTLRRHRSRERKDPPEDAVKAFICSGFALPDYKGDPPGLFQLVLLYGIPPGVLFKLALPELDI